MAAKAGICLATAANSSILISNETCSDLVCTQRTRDSRIDSRVTKSFRIKAWTFNKR